MKSILTNKITVEGDTLLYRVSGQGIPVLFISGGGGDGDLFLPLADSLSDKYKAITYDRRANAGSSMNHPDVFSVQQQAKDAAAIINAAGEQSAFVFGNSSGAVIALELFKMFPEKVRGIIAHEPPIARLHPNPDKWHTFFQSCYKSSFGFGGASWAATRFLGGIEVPAFQMIKAQMSAEKHLKKNSLVPKKDRIPSKQASLYLIRQELLPVTDYEPDIGFMADNKDKILLAVGSYAKEHNTFLFQIVKQLSEQIGKPYVLVPGHHGSFMDDIEHLSIRLNELIQNFYGI